METVSIVIPVYNSEPYLAQCLESLARQTYEDLEILCVDDGSTDRSPEILRGFARKDSRFRVYTKENEGRGAAPARNYGLDRATGTYLQVLDSDDFFEPDMVEVLVSQLEKTGAEMAICRALRFDHLRQRDAGRYFTQQFARKPREEAFCWRDCPDAIFDVVDIVPWNKLLRRDFVERNGLRFEPIPISDDQVFCCLAMVLAERITVVDRPLVHYRFNTGTSQVDSQARHPASAYLANYPIVNRLREKGIYEPLKRGYLCSALRIMRNYFDAMRDLATLRALHETYLREVLPFLEAERLPEGYFPDARVESWYRLITENSLDEILFQCARGHGSRQTTAILRFPFPYDEVSPGSAVALVGRGLVGRKWYAQALESEYCDIVSWVDTEQELPEGLACDQVLLAR